MVQNVSFLHLKIYNLEMIIAIKFQNKIVIFLDSILFLRLFPESVFLKSSVAKLCCLSAIFVDKGCAEIVKTA